MTRAGSFREFLLAANECVEPPQERSLREIRERVRTQALESIPDTPASIRADTYRLILGLPSITTAEERYFELATEIEDRVASLPLPTPVQLNQDRILREIERDVVRTFSTMAWFAQDLPQATKQDRLWKRIATLDAAEHNMALSIQRNAPSLSLRPPPENGEIDLAVSVPATPTATHFDIPPPLHHNDVPCHSRNRRLLRPLYVFATLNPGLSYVQGMNSIAAVLLWIFSTPGVSERQVEASCFFALAAILSQTRDLYVRSLDGTISPPPARHAILPLDHHVTPTGLGSTLDRFSFLLNWLDPTLSFHLLSSKKIDPSLYVFRWITTLFAGEFALPDLVRIWDRLVCLYPGESNDAPDEALSPLLGHVIDISLAIVMLKRQQLVSPFSDFDKCLQLLHDPQIEGAVVDRLLGVAWEIRERRLGLVKKVVAPPVSSFRQRFLSSASPTSSTTVPAPSPPSMARVESPSASYRSIREPSPISEAGDVDSEDDEPTLATRAASSWGAWKTSMARLGSSDAAATLSKTTTNLSIQAQMLRTQVAEQAPGRIAAMRANVTAASGRFMASTDSEGATAHGVRRPGSPVLEPFTPPTRWGDSPTAVSRDALSPASASAEMARGGSGGSSGGGGPRPLLLSGSARRAGNMSGEHSPPGSKRNSWYESPSINRGSVQYNTSDVISTSKQGSTSNPSRVRSHGRSPSSTSNFPSRPPHIRARSTETQSTVQAAESTASPSLRPGYTLADTPSQPPSEELSAKLNSRRKVLLPPIPPPIETSGEEYNQDVPLASPSFEKGELRRSIPSIKKRSGSKTNSQFFLDSNGVPSSDSATTTDQAESGLRKGSRRMVKKRSMRGSAEVEEWDEDDILDTYT